MLINGFMCIRIDKELFEKISIKCKLFFEKAILPKRLAKYLSELTITNATSPEEVSCCNMSEEEGDFIGCDDKNYQTKRFYFKCQRFTKTLKC